MKHFFIISITLLLFATSCSNREQSNCQAKVEKLEKKIDTLEIELQHANELIFDYENRIKYYESELEKEE
jgi:peptidoglycan hydrolase CwlO-like protein